MADAPHDMLSSNTPTDIKCSKEIKDDAIYIYKHIENFTSTVLDLYVAFTQNTYMVRPRISLQNALFPPSPIKYQHLKLL